MFDTYKPTCTLVQYFFDNAIYMIQNQLTLLGMMLVKVR